MNLEIFRCSGLPPGFFELGFCDSRELAALVRRCLPGLTAVVSRFLLSGKCEPFFGRRLRLFFRSHRPSLAPQRPNPPSGFAHYSIFQRTWYDTKCDFERTSSSDV